MKRFLYLLLTLPGFIQAQNMAATGLTLNGNIKGIPDKTRIFLTDANNPSDTVAKSTVKGGTFVLAAKLAEPNLYELNLGSPTKKLMLFVGPEHVTITGNAENVKELKVTGSSSQQDFVEFQKIFNPYFARLSGLSQLANSPGGMAKRDSIAKVYKNIADAVQSETDHFVATKNASYVSPFVLVVISQMSDDVFAMEKRYNQLTPEVQNGFYGKYLKEQIDNGKIGAIGTDEIDFTQTDTSGNPVTLSSLKGKYVLVDFWASWCKPCRMENPNVVAAYGKFKSKNFEVLGVSLDRARDPWIKAIHDDNLTWSQVSDLKFWNNEVAVKYKIQQIPQNILIDPNGKIIGKNLRGAELQSKLCELLGCN